MVFLSNLQIQICDNANTLENKKGNRILHKWEKLPGYLEFHTTVTNQVKITKPMMVLSSLEISPYQGKNRLTYDIPSPHHEFLFRTSNASLG